MESQKTLSQKTLSRPEENAVKLVGEAFLPGASLLLDGKILAGGAHLLLSGVAGALLGPVGVGLVIANSFSTSATGKSLLKQLSRGASEVKDDVVEVATETKKTVTKAGHNVKVELEG